MYASFPPMSIIDAVLEVMRGSVLVYSYVFLFHNLISILVYNSFFKKCSGRWSVS